MKYYKKQQAFDALLKNAPEHFTIEELCEAIELPYTTYYKWTSDRLDIRQDLIKKLAKRFTMRKQEAEKGQLVTIEITYNEAERARANQYNEEERQRIAELICYAYELGVSVYESCKALNVHQSTFFKWINLDSPIAFPYAADRFKLAQQTRRAEHNEHLSFTARAQLFEKLTERKVVSTTHVYEIKGGDEKPILKEKREVEKTFMPEMSAIALVLNNLDHDFRKATAGGQIMDEDYELQQMDEKELMVELQKERERNESLTGQNLKDGGTV